MEAGKEIIKKLLEEITSDIKKDMRSRGQYATGQTERLFEIRVTQSGSIIEGELYGPDYIQSLVTGRGPSLREGGQSRSLRESILEWIKAKGITANDGKTQEQLSWAISTYIHKYGTQLYIRSGDTGILKNNITESRISAAVESFTAEIVDAKLLETNKIFQK